MKTCGDVTTTCKNVITTCILVTVACKCVITARKVVIAACKVKTVACGCVMKGGGRIFKLLSVNSRELFGKCQFVDEFIRLGRVGGDDDVIIGKRCAFGIV